MFNVAVYLQFFAFCQQNLARSKDDSTLLIAYIFFFFDKFCTLWNFCADIYFMYVELGSMWTLVDLC